MQPKILYSPSTILSDYMSTSLKNKIVDLVNSRSFIMKRFISGEQKKIWITRVGENSYRWAVKNKNGDRPEETKDFNDTIAILHCFSCPVEEVEEAIEKEEDKVVPFLDTYLTLLNACDYKEVYGHYFVEF